MNKFNLFIKSRLFLALLVFSCAVVFGAFVWPTAYHYEQASQTLIRINRISGSAQKLTAFGWYSLEQPAGLPAGYQLDNPPKLETTVRR